MEGFETFSPTERAYMESRGEKPIDDAPAVEEEATETDNEAVEDEGSEVEAKEEPEAKDEAPEEDEKPKRKTSAYR